MTFSVRSDSAGNYGALQVGGADKLILNSDGSLVATTDPATGVRSHALATMQKFSDEFGSSLAANGYQKLPSGLIIQWLSGITVAGNGVVSFTWPIAFPNAVYAAFVSALTPLDGGDININFRTVPSVTGGSITNGIGTESSANTCIFGIGR